MSGVTGSNGLEPSNIVFGDKATVILFQQILSNQESLHGRLDSVIERLSAVEAACKAAEVKEGFSASMIDVEKLTNELSGLRAAVQSTNDRIGDVEKRVGEVENTISSTKNQVVGAKRALGYSWQTIVIAAVIIDEIARVLYWAVWPWILSSLN